jgi:hypothetical protein
MPEVAEATHERTKAELGVCEDCGYELTFVRGAACPECGAPATLLRPELSRRYLAVRRVMLGAALILWGVPGAGFLFLSLVTVLNLTTENDGDVVKGAMSAAFVPLCVVLCGVWLLASPLGGPGIRAGPWIRAVCVLALVVAGMMMAQRVVARAGGGGPVGKPLAVLSTGEIRDYLRWALLGLGPPMSMLLLLVCAGTAREMGLHRTAQRWSMLGWVGGAVLCVLIVADAVAQRVWQAVVISTAPGGGTSWRPVSAAYYPEKASLLRMTAIAAVAVWVSVTWLIVLRLRMLLDRVPRPSASNV